MDVAKTVLDAKSSTILWRDIIAFAVIGLTVGLIIAAMRKGDGKAYVLAGGIAVVVGATAGWVWAKHGPTGLSFGG